MKLISWNVGGRTGQMKDQAVAVERQDADVVCLQEVRPSTLPLWSERLARAGLAEIVNSGGRSDRQLFNLTASHWPVIELPEIPLPQRERLLSARIESDAGPVEVHNVHVPAVPGERAIRAATLEAIQESLAVPFSGHRILCGDFNTRRRDLAHRTLVEGLEPWGLEDIFRKMNGDDAYVLSSSQPGFERKSGFRLDHVLASEALNPVWCDYQHGWRQNGLSDHSAMEAIFEPRS